MRQTKETLLGALVEMYATAKAYDEVSRTCMLIGFSDLRNKRWNDFNAEMRRYARKYYSTDAHPAARAMDDVLNRYNQLTIWEG